MTVPLNGCGNLSSSQTRTENGPRRSQIGAKENQPEGTASLSLQLPSTIPSAVDQVKVTLTPPGQNDCPKRTDATTFYPLCIALKPLTLMFSTKSVALQIDKLAPGNYSITIDLLDSKKGVVHIHGDF